MVRGKTGQIEPLWAKANEEFLVSEKGFLGIRHEGLISDCVENSEPGGDCTYAFHLWLDVLRGFE